MQSPEHANLSPAHKERNWRNTGEAADDLILLKKLIYTSVEVLNKFTEEGEVIEFPNFGVILQREGNFAQYVDSTYTIILIMVNVQNASNQIRYSIFMRLQ